MKKRIVSLVVFAVVFGMFFGCAGGDEEGDGVNWDDTYTTCENPDSSQVIWFGYFFAASGRFGNYIDEVADHSNFVHIADMNMEFIRHAIEKNLKVVIMIYGENVLNDPISFKGFANELVDYREHLIGIYLYDEPGLWDITKERQEEAIYKVKERLPDVPIWVTYSCYNVDESLDIPNGYDIISVSPDYGKTNSRKMKEKIDIIIAKKQPHQKIVLIGDGYVYWDMYPNNEQKLQSLMWKKAKNAQAYNNIAACSNGHVIGIMPFTWGSIWLKANETGAGGAGVRDLPILQKEYKEISYDIINK